MIPVQNQVWLVVEPIDMRAGIDGLSQRIQNTLGRSPCDGSAYAFHNRRQNRLKLLVWDGRRLALSAAPASRPLHLANLEYHHLRRHVRAMGLADGG